MSRRGMLVNSVVFFLVAVLTTDRGRAQEQISDFDRVRALDMLQVVTDDVRKHYYDPTLRGLDWNAKVAEAKRRIEKTNSMNMALSEIAAALDALNDSHTFFIPPPHANHFDYGFQYQLIGEQCFVTRVRPKSDAEAKGVKPGDEVLTLNGYRPTRENLRKMQYVFSALRPQPGFRLGLQDPDRNQREVDVLASVREGKPVTNLTFSSGSDIWDLVREGQNQQHLKRAREAQVGDQLMILKIPEFLFSDSEVDSIISKARKYPAVIIDLRGNPGGSIETLRSLTGSIFDRDVKIADRVGRKEGKNEVAKAARHPFTGKLAVLVDARSASAAELFARVVQLERRGVVIGDHTSGSVMEAEHFNEKSGIGRIVFFGVSVTEWDLLMTDGKSLEHVGVTPDEIVLPTAKDLAGDNDPVIARAGE